ncbi:hypothetical protein IFM47457_05788 [Aspergillus lentulus]|nr:hypothetical protein IFM47457_05788 [Aspergillus lentulus]
MRCCVYFTFFGKPAQAGPTEHKNKRETPRDMDNPPLLLSCLNKNKVSNSPWGPNRMWNSKLYPAGKH